MKTIRLNTNNDIPVVGLGTWKSETGFAYNAVRWAIKAGYQHIDTAPVYGNQMEIGQALKDAVNEGDIKRENLFITSKLWNDAHAKEDVLPALRETLEELKLDYLDLFLMHWPVAQDKTSKELVSLKETPLEETWEQMESALDAGLVKSIGVSNFGLKTLREFLPKVRHIPSMNQVENHPFLQQRELVDFCKNHNIAVTAYAPLGSNDRSADMKGEDEPSLLENAVVKEIAERIDATPAQVLLAFQLTRGLIVIPKSVNFARIQENLAAQSIVLDADDMKKLSSLERGYRFIDGTMFKGADYLPETMWDV